MATIKVYKTTVNNPADAELIEDLIHCEIPSCEISFDLEDCDNVLRIESYNGEIDEEIIERIFNKSNHTLEELPL